MNVDDIIIWTCCISNLGSSHSILHSIKLPVVPSRARQGIGARGVAATCATGAVKGAFLRGISVDATGPTPPSFGSEKSREEISPFWISWARDVNPFWSTLLPSEHSMGLAKISSTVKETCHTFLILFAVFAPLALFDCSSTTGLVDTAIPKSPAFSSRFALNIAKGSLAGVMPSHHAPHWWCGTCHKHPSGHTHSWMAHIEGKSPHQRHVVSVNQSGSSSY